MDGVTASHLKSKDFIWTDEKSALILKVVQECKTGKTTSGLDWETVRTKYSNYLCPEISKLIIERVFPTQRKMLSLIQ